MNSSRFKIGVLGACVAIIAAAWLFLRSDSTGDERLRALEGEVATLRQQLQNYVSKAASVYPVTPRPANEASPASPTDSATSEQIQQITGLTSTLDRLEAKIQDLEKRLRHPVMLAELEKEIHALARRSQEATAEVQRIAARFNVTLDERAFTDYGFATPLDNQPGFVEARTRMLQTRRILKAAQTKYVTELFERPDKP